MNVQFHKAQARRLIRLVGGVEACAAICELSVVSISNYQNPSVKAFMPIWVIDLLQQEIGNATYSDAVSERAKPRASKSLLEDAMATASRSGALPEQVHEALADGRIDEAERRQLMAAADEIRARADAVTAALSGES